MPSPPFAQHHPPHWWPAHEPWPPSKGPWRARRRASFIWRGGCLLLALVLMAMVAAALGLWVTAIAVGAVTVPLGALAGAIAAFLISSVVVVALLRGVRLMAAQLVGLVDAARRIEEGDYGARLEGPRRGELRAVARAFNSMASRLQATDERRRTFLAEMAHELRTPIAVIHGQLEALSDGVYPIDAEHLEPALAQVRTLERLVEDVRTLGLAETGSLPLAIEPVDPALLVNETLAGFRGAAASSVTLSTDLPAALPSVPIDPARIRTVLANLIANAIAHTPAGGSVRVLVRADRESLRVEVRDSGAGIPPELLPRVFDRFVKGPGSPGSGLGLAIARDVVEAHGGTITAESEPGQGTVVRFELPVGSD
jgi:two-component system, OmpR family, sensor histidine kinase BaeS